MKPKRLTWIYVQRDTWKAGPFTIEKSGPHYMLFTISRYLWTHHNSLHSAKMTARRRLNRMDENTYLKTSIDLAERRGQFNLADRLRRQLYEKEDNQRRAQQEDQRVDRDAS